jgi:antitoxin component HigA of HigAB toxin-antitoxin module
VARHGIGRYVAAEASGLNPRRIAEIRSGKKANIRERTERAILSITMDARGAKTLVDAKPVWAQIEHLLSEGLTRRELARRLGSRSKTPALQLGRRAITAQSAMRFERLLSTMRADPCKRYQRRPMRLRPIPQRRL